MAMAWQKTRLKYIADCNRRVLPESTEDARTFKYIDIGAVGQGSIIVPAESTSFVDSPSRARRLAEPGDIIISTVRTYLRAVATVPDVDEGLVFSTGFAVLHPRDAVNLDYLAYVLQGDEFVDKVVANSVGVSYPAITASDLMALDLLLPPLDEQRAIADYLDQETAQIDALVDKQEEFIGLLRERRTTVLVSQFDSANRRRLRHALEFAQTGPFGTQLSATEYVTNGVPVVNPSHIKGGMIEPDFSISVTSEKAEELRRHRLEVGDIVLGRKGEVDKSALVTADEAGLICGSDSMLLRPAASVWPSYLWWFFQSSEAHNQLERWSVGSTVAGLNQITISKVTVPLPSISEQRRIVAHITEQTARMDTLIAKAEEHIVLAKERRSALITAAVTGEFDVRTATKGARV